ncbi:hypothetical protein [Helicobacter anatolicus]|uniref:hypothetical protein n=1 Tax=Helicobacter anatolicus TaxID=2905874 RepID=UPI001E387B18|nr:hypothetical protein [Helicobacter anatolicus]MCE3038674.1 hypothetical protein [Helicobacter anatolicus]
MQQIIEEIMFVLKRHKGYMMDENEILEILTKPQNYEFSKKLALKIFQELECLKDQKEILESFIFTQKFLEKFQLTMKGI